MKDLFGLAILDYQTNNEPEDIVTETSISEEDALMVSYLFRKYAEMPKIEQLAMDLASGEVLDVGCGAGSHSLYLQNEKHLDVTAVDLSENAIEACRLRGIKKAIAGDIMSVNLSTYNTILLLMNGAGMCGKLEKIPVFLKRLRSLLKPGGSIYVDSSDIVYMFDEDEDGGKWIPGDHYYGEVTFQIKYKGAREEPFDWLYIDYGSLYDAAAKEGLNCELLMEGDHFDYLARLSI